MALFEGKTPAERNKMIAAIALPILALIFVFNMLSGPSRPTPTTTANSNANGRPGGARPATTQQRAPGAAAADAVEVSPADTTPIVCCAEPSFGSDAGRNIFAFYVKPVPAPTVVPTVEATPQPTPEKQLAALMPQSVFA